jgi:hypothetical protein
MSVIEQRLPGVATERILQPYRSPYREEPFGPANGRKRTDLVYTQERRAHARPSTVSTTRYACRDHGRRVQVRTWQRLPVVAPAAHRRG